MQNLREDISIMYVVALPPVSTTPGGNSQKLSLICKSFTIHPAFGIGYKNIQTIIEYLK